MARLVKREAIGVGIETSQGTYVAPTNVSASNTGYFYAEGVDIQLVSENIERNYNRSTLDPVSIVKGKKSATLKFKCELLHSGADTEQSVIKTLFEACGMIHGGASDFFLPISTAPSNFSGASKSCSFLVNKDGMVHKLKGCVGNFKLILEAGKIAMLEFDFKGLVEGSTFGTASAIGTIYYANNGSGVTNAVQKSSAFAFNSITDFIVPKIDIDMGNEIVERLNIEASQGIEGYALIGRKPTMNVSIEAPLTSTDVIGFFESGTEAAASVDAIDYLFEMPKAQVISANYTDIGGILGHDISFQLNTSSGDDCIKITADES